MKLHDKNGKKRTTKRQSRHPDSAHIRDAYLDQPKGALVLKGNERMVWKHQYYGGLFHGLSI